MLYCNDGIRENRYTVITSQCPAGVSSQGVKLTAKNIANGSKPPNCVKKHLKDRVCRHTRAICRATSLADLS
jgi:hypothetical protein